MSLPSDTAHNHSILLRSILKGHQPPLGQQATCEAESTEQRAVLVQQAAASPAARVEQEL